MIKIIKDIKKTLQGDHAQRPDPHHPRWAQHLEPAHQVSQDLSPVIIRGGYSFLRMRLQSGIRFCASLFQAAAATQKSNPGQRCQLLRAREVRESDRDCYMCQINTERMKKQVEIDI